MLGIWKLYLLHLTAVYITFEVRYHDEIVPQGQPSSIASLMEEMIPQKLGAKYIASRAQAMSWDW